MTALIDWRRPWPLVIVVMVHVLFFYALQSGLMARVGDAPAVREVLAALIPPEPRMPERKIEPPRPLPMRATQPKPVKPVTAPQPAVLPPVNSTPSETAITLPPSPPESVPIPIATPPAPLAPTPVAAAPIAPVSPPAPLPISPPRFDAAYLNNPPPAYPALSRRAGEQGSVMLRVRVTEDGRAAEINIKTSSGSSRLDEAAQAAVRHWRFVPARQGDQVVSAWVLVPLVFKLEG
jgi:protein TonB